MLQATGHPSEIPGILPAISAGYRGTVLVVKGVWLVMTDIMICQTGLIPAKNAEGKHLPNRLPPEH